MSKAELLDYAQTCLLIVLRLSLIPILVATVIGVVIYREGMTVLSGVGVALVLAAVVLLNVRFKHSDV